MSPAAWQLRAQRSPDHLTLSRIEPRCGVLGPGLRCVVWVQGCPLRCPGCVAPALLGFDGGHEVPVAEIAAQIIADRSLDGVTFSGGEPFAQAAALAQLVRMVREARPDFSVMSFSGFTLEWLEEKGVPAQRDLLEQLDILVDGPYREELHGSLLWRGSSNQRIHLLSGRHPEIAEMPDVSAGLEMALDPAGNLRWAGVPPVKQFRPGLAGGLVKRGLNVKEVRP